MKIIGRIGQLVEAVRCLDCAEPFESRNKRQVRCPSCQHTRKKTRDNKREVSKT